jgi:ubiquinone/menaquinone biosynthesis C-methylase UbiE
MTTTHWKYAWSTAGEAALLTGESYERYLGPTIGLPFARPVIEAAGLQPGERALDLACGTGVAARLAAEHVAPTGTVVGIDPNPSMLEVARRTSPDIDWNLGTAENVPLADESVDVVACSLGFQFFADKARALQEMRRVLAHGGRAAIGTPGPIPPPMAAIAEVLSDHIGPEASTFVEAVFSVHQPDQIRVLLDAAGFDQVAVSTRTLTLRVPPPADFFWQYVYGTPLAGIATELDDDTKTVLEREVVLRCQSFLHDNQLVMEPGVLMTTAHRS